MRTTLQISGTRTNTIRLLSDKSEYCFNLEKCVSYIVCKLWTMPVWMRELNVRVNQLVSAGGVWWLPNGFIDTRMAFNVNTKRRCSIVWELRTMPVWWSLPCPLWISISCCRQVVSKQLLDVPPHNIEWKLNQLSERAFQQSARELIVD